MCTIVLALIQAKAHPALTNFAKACILNAPPFLAVLQPNQRHTDCVSQLAKQTSHLSFQRVSRLQLTRRRIGFAETAELFILGGVRRGVDASRIGACRGRSFGQEWRGRSRSRRRSNERWGRSRSKDRWGRSTSNRVYRRWRASSRLFFDFLRRWRTLQGWVHGLRHLSCHLFDYCLKLWAEGTEGLCGWGRGFASFRLGRGRNFGGNGFWNCNLRRRWHTGCLLLGSCSWHLGLGQGIIEGPIDGPRVWDLYTGSSKLRMGIYIYIYIYT